MTGQDNKELLLRVVLRVAARQLQDGGLMPFAATLGTHRNVDLLVPKGVKKEVTPEELEAYWVQQLRAAVAEHDCTAVCYCADIRSHDVEGEVTPILFVHLEVAGSDAEDITYAYGAGADSAITLNQKSVVPSTALVLT